MLLPGAWDRALPANVFVVLLVRPSFSALDAFLATLGLVCLELAMLNPPPLPFCNTSYANDGKEPPPAPRLYSGNADQTEADQFPNEFHGLCRKAGLTKLDVPDVSEVGR